MIFWWRFSYRYLAWWGVWRQFLIIIFCFFFFLGGGAARLGILTDLVSITGLFVAARPFFPVTEICFMVQLGLMQNPCRA